MNSEIAQIEIWRKQFESLCNPEHIRKFPSGTYQWSFMEDRWNGFLIAKRSMPVVELPAERWVQFNYNYSGYCFESSKVINAIKKAGIQYKVKGE